MNKNVKLPTQEAYNKALDTDLEGKCLTSGFESETDPIKGSIRVKPVCIWKPDAPVLGTSEREVAENS
jgi:hypothetical protein